MLSSEPLAILQVEDNLGDTRLVADYLKDESSDLFTLTHVCTLDEAQNELSNQHFDVILLDLALLESSGLEALEHLVSMYPNRAIIVLTGCDDVSLALKAMNKGAQDYLVKGCSDSDLIWRSIRYSIERKRTEEKLEFLAHYDVLTKLANRTLFEMHLQQALFRVERNNQLSAVLFLDLDRFKVVNDNFGHDTGDIILSEVANRLNQCVRKQDSVARFGGDEFVVLLEGVKSCGDVRRIAEKICQKCSKPIQLLDEEVFITASVGIAMCEGGVFEPMTYIKQADIAMYQAKEKGRNNYQFYSEEINAFVKVQAMLETSLHRALEKRELDLYFQPQVNTKTGEIWGMEALLRWFHPKVGNVSPDIFIPLLEDTGLIVEVGEWVLLQACTQFVDWQSKGLLPPNTSVSVNLSARQFVNCRILDAVSLTLEVTGINPECLILEITESMLVEDVRQAEAILGEIHRLGVKIGIDDFGTGYSSLLYLKRFPIDHLKVDKSFLIDIEKSKENAAITSAVIQLAHALGLMVIAEGVETQEALSFISDYECDVYQGFFFSMAISRDDFTELLLRQSKTMSTRMS
ncbi:hypothetical protein GCM10007876_09190 [Litoribrevibacter albus]|uniref:cyclic-guanylate-specific phosphodiesterase n=2 Tax=Litoribrevibacter albus TaxID=1473156 RepID=A0AA37S865_9GAMM|nr:hypothetical protein GCM10007876_09190 [Litoribrevibacter albus]